MTPDSNEMSDSDVLVRAEGVCKKFCRSLKKSLWYGINDMTSEVMGGKGHHDTLRQSEFWAVDDVSFSLRRGECLGLIGHNGAGKTTLLKMLNGLIKPDCGRIEMRGRVGALIALGAGFSPILTGRENIYVNGSVLGLSKREIEGRMDEIIEFAGVREFIDSPVQSYSSGMQVRLGFAVASALSPDTLLVDEVLAVGDLNFRMKCLSRISSLLRSGASIILVSHSMTDIQRICSRVIVMDHGKISFAGAPAFAIAKYESLGLAQGRLSADSYRSSTTVSLGSFVVETSLHSNDGSCSIRVRTGETVVLRGELQVRSPIHEARLRIFIESAKAGILCSISSAQEHPIGTMTEGCYAFEVSVPAFPFLVGAYGVGISVHGEDTTVHLSISNAAIIEVVEPDVLAYGRSNSGIVAIPTEWNVTKLPQAGLTGGLSNRGEAGLSRLR